MPEEGSPIVLESRSTAEAARVFVTGKFASPESGRIGLVVWRGDFYEWYAGSYWVQRDRAWVERSAIEFFETAFIREWGKGGTHSEEPLRFSVNEIKDIVWTAERLYASPFQHAPCWLEREGDGPFPDLDHCIIFRDRVVDVKATAALRAQDPEADLVTFPVSSNVFATTALRVDLVDKGAPCERWIRAGKEWGDGDAEHFELLERVGGYALMGTRKYKKGPLQYGKADTGKGVFTNHVLMPLLPRNAVQSTRMKTLVVEFGQAGARGSSIVLVRECTDLHRGEGAEFASIWKAWLGGDEISTNIKNRDHMQVLFRCLPMMQSNAMLTLPNDYGATSKKLIIIPYTRSFHENPEYELGEVIRGELPGIARRLAEAAVRLEMERDAGKKFPVIEEARKVMAEYVEETAPFDAFLEWGFRRGGWLDSDLVRRAFKMYDREREQATGRKFDVRLDQLPSILVKRSSWNLKIHRRRGDGAYGIAGLSLRSDLRIPPK